MKLSFRVIAFFIALFSLLFIPSQARAQHDGGYDGSYSNVDSSYGGSDGSYDGGYGSDGTYQDSNYDSQYGNCSTQKLTGFVYLDLNNDSTFNGGDTAMEGQYIQLILPPGSGNVVAQYRTDNNGHYDTGNLPANVSYDVHLAIQPVPGGFTYVNPNTPTINMTFRPNVCRTRNWAVRGPYTKQAMPVAGCSGTTGSIHLSWNESGGSVADYKVLIQNYGSTQWVDIGFRTGGPRSADLGVANAGLSPGRQYSFLIAALDSGGNAIYYSDNTQWSHEKFATYTTFPDCAATGSFTINPPNSTCTGTTPTVGITWTDVANFSGGTYTVYYRAVPGGAETPVYSTSANTGYTFGQTAPVVNLTPGGQYGFLVAATNLNGTSYAGWTDGMTGSGYGPTTVRSDCVAAPPPVGTYTLSGRVYRESSGSCSFGAGDTPLSGQTIELDPYYTGASQFTTTDGNGNYSFTGIPAQYYYARYSTIPPNHQRLDPTNFDVLLNISSNLTQNFCLSQIPTPTITYRITTSDGISSNDPSMTSPTLTIVPVKISIPTTISWTISNATSVTTSWGQAITAPGAGSVNGSFTVPTSAAGTTLYTLSAVNGPVSWGSGTFQVQVENTNPFIQTTGGDVHTNENIYITPR